MENKIKFWFLILLLAITTLSCVSKRIPQRIKEDFTNRLEGKPTGLDSLININGYYEMLLHNETPVNLMFFEDGTFVHNFFSCMDFRDDMVGYFEHLNRFRECAKHAFPRCGVYKVSGDTIIAQYIQDSSLMAPWIAKEHQFKIIDRRTLKYINSNFIGRDLSIENPEKKRFYSSKFSLATFIEVKELPLSLCWLKEEKWVWSNESDWQLYIDADKRFKNKSGCNCR